MMSETQKKNISTRLRRIAGQLAGVQRMIDEDRYCIDIVTQTTAIVAALRTVEDLVMQNHLDRCFADAMPGRNPAERQEKITEVMTVIGKLRKRG